VAVAETQGLHRGTLVKPVLVKRTIWGACCVAFGLPLGNGTRDGFKTPTSRGFENVSAAQTGRSDSPGSQRTVWDGVYTAEQAKRGETAYRESCARCHLDTLKGNDMAPGLVGDAFVQEWDGKTVRAFYGRILSTMPADDPGSLDEKAVLDIVTYALQVNGFPAGSHAIETADEAQQIKMTRAK
jgi:mono/diheme cytochrome c family protein